VVRSLKSVTHGQCDSRGGREGKRMDWEATRMLTFPVTDLNPPIDQCLPNYGAW